MQKVAVADIGSNSARLVVMRRFGDAAAIPIAESKYNLRLQLKIDESGAVPDETVEQIISLLSDFKAVADAAKVEALVAVGTSALRDSVNATQVVKRVWQGSGVDLRVLSGEEEALLSFRGAVSSLQSESGVALDVGGGSLELIRFEDRRAVDTAMLRLGALRLTERFLSKGTDPKSISALKSHIARKLGKTKFQPLAEGESLIGTGGTIRNLAKMHRRKAGGRFARLHGQAVPVDEIEDSVRRLIAMKPSRRGSVPGLNPDRAGSMIAGASSALGAARLVKAESILVSGTGLREGLALEAFNGSAHNGAGSAVRAARDMALRFATWDVEKAARRSALANLICEKLGDRVDSEFRQATVLAAETLDTGTAIDYYSRYEAAAWLVVNSNIGALTHRQIALIAAISIAGDRSTVQLAQFKSQIKRSEIDAIKRAGAVLRLADEIEMRLGPSGAATLDIQPSQKRGEAITASWDGVASWNNASALKRFKSAFKESVRPIIT